MNKFCNFCGTLPLLSEGSGSLWNHAEIHPFITMAIVRLIIMMGLFVDGGIWIFVEMLQVKK